MSHFRPPGWFIYILLMGTHVHRWGVLLDPALLLGGQVATTTRKSARDQLRLVRHSGPFLAKKALTNYSYLVHIQTALLYDALCEAALKRSQEFQEVGNASVCMLTGARRRVHVTPSSLE